jgi:putative addiction module killer protein
MKYEIETTEDFDEWFLKLKDKTIKTRLLSRIDRIKNGNFGDFKLLDANLFELRFFFGDGFRIYYTIQNKRIVFLLTGGDKATQQNDIKKALSLLAQLEE